MNTCFGLGFHPSSGRPWQKSFKSKPACALFEDYLERISHYSPVKAEILPFKPFPKAAQIWICHTGPEAKAVTSEQLATRLEQTRDSGTRELFILIGGADGFTKKDLEYYEPQFKWSFGPLTLPHELAAVTAAEQIYRAWTILHRLPYHSGH